MRIRGRDDWVVRMRRLGEIETAQAAWLEDSLGWEEAN